MANRSAAFLLSSVLALFVAQAPAEEVTGVYKGRVELSTAASLGFTQDASGDNDDLTAINVPVRLGYLFTDRFGIEGEVLLTHLNFGNDDDSSTGFLGSASFVFHLSPRARTTAFLLAGGGAGNGVEFVTIAADSDTTVTTLQAGVGLKSFLGRRAALRVEYRFTHTWGDEPDEFSTKVELNNHKLLFGFSVFFG